MKHAWMIAFALFIAFGAHAQRKGKKKDAASGNPSTNAQPAPAPATNPQLLPLFGSQPKSEVQLREDQAFLAECDRSFGSREEASKFFETRAWEYLAEGKQDTAIHRFNLAWLLNGKNANPYWGLGAISAGQGKTDEGIDLLTKALALESNNAGMLVDAASLRLNRYKEKNNKQEVEISRGLLNQAIGVDSTNGDAYAKLSMVYFYLDDYDKAWENLHKSRSISIAGMDFSYLTELIAKKPDPMGMFK